MRRDEFFEEFFTQMSDGGNWSASRPGGLISGQGASSTHKKGNCTKARISLVLLERRKRKLLPCGIEADFVERPALLVVALLNDNSWENRGDLTP